MKCVPEMTYNVSGGILNPTHSLLNYYHKRKWRQKLIKPENRTTDSTVMSTSLPSRLDRLDAGRTIPRGVVWAIDGRPHTLLSRRIGLMMCVTLEMARFMLRGVFDIEKARLTRRPNLNKLPTYIITRNTQNIEKTKPCLKKGFKYNFLNSSVKRLPIFIIFSHATSRKNLA